MEAVDLRILLKSAMEMVQFKIKAGQMKLESEIDENSPKVWGNFTQLQEVFFNIIDNSYDAMMQRKDELKEEGYQPTIHFSVLTFDSKVEIKIQDNGIGVKGENVEKLFTPFFTTKATSKKGTGLGLYVIRQLIEENHDGKVDFKSEYKVGSQTRITLPVAKKKPA
jgi:signal transduction histidine kinase